MVKIEAIEKNGEVMYGFRYAKADLEGNYWGSPTQMLDTNTALRAIKQGSIMLNGEKHKVVAGRPINQEDKAQRELF